MKIKPSNYLILLFTILLICTISCKKDSPLSPETLKYAAWAVGQKDSNNVGILLYSDDCGETWARQNSHVFSGSILNNIVALNKNNIWIAGSDNCVFYTNDGGKNWVKRSLSISGKIVDIKSISIASDIIWISGNEGFIGKSSDHGLTWEQQDTTMIPTKYLMQGIYAINENVVYAVGNRPGENPAGIVVYTKNGGIIWDSVNAPNNYGNLHGWIGVKATDTNNVCVYGGRGNFMVTANAGHSWITGGPVSNSDINDLIMLDYHTYWTACDYDLIFITENYGVSWTLQPSAGPGNSFLFGISAIDRQNALIVAESAGMFPMGKILKTSDGGKTWLLKYTSGYNLYKIATARL